MSASANLFGSPFAPVAPSTGGPGSLPFGGETRFGFVVPQGDPGEIQAAGTLALAIAGGWLTKAQDVRTGSQAALGDWRGDARTAFGQRAGALIGVLDANSESLSQAAGAMQKLASVLEVAQKACLAAAQQCTAETKIITEAQAAADQHGRDADELTRQAAVAAHPAAQSELMRQAAQARASAADAQSQMAAATARLNEAVQTGVRADNQYNSEAEGLARQITAAHAQLKPVPDTRSATPVPVQVSAADRNVAKRLLAAAQELPMPKNGNIGQALNKLAGGPLTPGTILALQQDAAQARRQYEHENVFQRFADNVYNEAGGFTHYASFGTVSFGNPNSFTYKAGEAVAAVPVDPDALASDAAHGAERTAAHLAETGAAGDVAKDGVDLSGATTVTGKFPQKAEPGATLVRRDPATGQPTNYQEYGRDGVPTKRVDLTGSSHGGIDTPHVHEYGRNTNPKTGQTFVNPAPVRPANPKEVP